LKNRPDKIIYMRTIRLRALTTTDIPKTLEWNNQKEIKQLYADHPFPVNLEMEKEWYEKILRSNFPTTVFGIELDPDEKLIGISILKDINLIHRKAEFAILIGESKERGKGYSEAATIKTLIFGFNNLGLNRIFLHVLKNNKVAIELYNKIGFKQEGELRESCYKEGRFHNEIIMSILFSDYKRQDEL